MTRVSSSPSPAFTRLRASGLGRALGALVGAALAWSGARQAFANPDGGTVVGGSATITQTAPKTLTINQHTDKAIINWRNFSIGAGETTNFVQPSVNSAVLDRVTSGQVSQILGRLTANGKVFLINPNGVVFGGGAQVDVGSLITSTHDIRNQDFLAHTLRFTLAGREGARIVNQGSISVTEGGLVALVAPSIENSGVIYARLGRVALAAGDAVTIDPYGDDLITFEVPEGVAEQLTDPEANPLAALIDLSGDIIADGGGVLVTADAARDAVDRAINMTGYVQARSLETSAGKVVLEGGAGDIQLAGTIDASGLDRATGGQVRVVTDGRLSTAAASQILAEGGDAGGNGGFAAVSAWARQEMAGRVSVKARSETGENGWLYQGANTAAARTIRNPNLQGAGRVGEGTNSVYFEANQGQTGSDVDFLTRGDSATMFLSAADAVLAMDTDGGDREVLTTALDGANRDVTVTGEDKQQGTVNYLIGDESGWVTGVETYRKVRYEDVYEGIDLVYYGNRAGDLEFDLEVAAGADASQVKLDYSGAESITKTAGGDLVIDTGSQTVVQKAPMVYQETAEARVLVPGEYAVGADGKVTIDLNDYDRTQALVIDPVVNYSTFLGGSDNENSSTRGGAVAIDSSGNSYVTGRTASADFPTTGGDVTFGGTSDAFVRKYDDSGNLVYSTYLGGSGMEIAYDVAVDTSGKAHVTGTTGSADFGVTDASSLQGTQDAFIARLNAAGTAIDFGTYLGGSLLVTPVSFGNTITVDGSGNIYAAGSTTATNFATTAGAYDQTFSGSEDGWIAKYDNAGTQQWVTLLGGATAGAGQNEEIHGLDIDTSGNVYVTGRTQTTDFPTTGGANQGATGGGDDAFLSKISADGTTLLYSSFHGGSGDETGYDVEVDDQGQIIAVGSTTSADFPTANAAQGALSGAQDAFVTKFNLAGGILYSTYLGGSGSETAYRVASTSTEGAIGVVGSTSSADLTTVDPTQAASGGGTDEAYGVDILGTSTMVVAGQTASAAFPTQSPHQGTFGGGAGSGDAFWFSLSIADLFLPDPPIRRRKPPARSTSADPDGRRRHPKARPSPRRQLPTPPPR